VRAEDRIVEVAFPSAGLPEEPPQALDPFLDAATRCIARHGVRRTTVADIAKEMGVSRMTVYRQVGTIDRVVQLLFARDLHRLFATIPSLFVGADGAEAVVTLATALVEWVRTHPVGYKVLTDEPDVVGELLAGPLISSSLELGTEVLAELLEKAMAADILGQCDPTVTATWLVRLVFSVILVPPPTSTADYLAGVIRPLLDKASPSPRPSPRNRLRSRSRR
jgi:AcrR family transcriptional regulator